jgi:CO/xanthine dehydrogenase Mo-binding subunit
MSEIVKLDRRDFLKLGAAAGGGLFLGVYLPGQGAETLEAATAHAIGPLQPNAFVRVDTDGTVTIWSARADMGQGVRTALPMIVADEMDADWETVRIVQADAHPDKYGSQMTVGSSSVRRGAWMRLRQAGASAREMLIAAAAAEWGVAASTCRTERGRVLHDASDRSLGYGALAEAAAALPVPQDPEFKDASEFRLIGTSPPLVDTALKVTGKAGFGMDVRLTDMRFATVVHCPVFGGSVGSVDATEALEVPGVREVVQVSQGVAVVAGDTWAAFKGARALDITWNTGDFSMNSEEITGYLEGLTESSGVVARDDGAADAALGQAASRVEATYEAPFLAHATMEPMNCTADVRSDSCEVWAPTQNPQGTQRTAAQITGLPIERVTAHTTYLGCGWGRRSSTDFVRDAVETSIEVGAPVQVVWTREEDMQHDFYRPASCSVFEGGVDADGHVNALKIRVAATPIGGGRRGGGNGVDRNSVDGMANMQYRIPNVFIDYCRPDLPVPIGYWRSVGPSQNTFMVESFIDELAHAGGRDPFELRREMLEHYPRLKHVLEVAAEKAAWDTPLPAGRARGIAVVEDKGGLVAQVAEVSVSDGEVRVHRVTCAADCGQVIHTGIVEAQIEGCIVGGLTAALYGEITLDDGRVTQGNFHDYPMLRMREMPEIDVHIVESREEPGGAGEPALPPIAPAVANAVFALTGTRIRRLPIRLASASASAGATDSN